MIEKVFQVASLVIMTFGIVGLPLYLYLNARRKRLLNEYNEENCKEGTDDTADTDDTDDASSNIQE